MVTADIFARQDKKREGGGGSRVSASRNAAAALDLADQSNAVEGGVEERRRRNEGSGNVPVWLCRLAVRVVW